LLAVDFFFKRPTSDEAVNNNSLLLSNAIHSVYKTTRWLMSLLCFVESLWQVLELSMQPFLIATSRGLSENKNVRETN